MSVQKKNQTLPADIQLGDIVKGMGPMSAMYEGDKSERVPMVGRVVYIHPERRFGILEFEGKNGRFRESWALGVGA